MPGYSLVRACMLDSKEVGWHQAPRWFHLKFIMNCFEEKIWSLNCLCIVVCFYWLPLKLYIILRNIILKRFWYPHFIQIDTQCYYSSLHCRVQFEMRYPTLLYGPILLVILRNVPPYYVISHSSVIWNSGVQRRMDQGRVQDTPASPAVQSSMPAPRHDSTPRRTDTPSRTPERPRTPQRSPRTPVRCVRTPVRQARGYSDSTESRSCSPVSRSSSVTYPSHLPEMCLRSTSPRLWTRMPRDPFPMTRMTRVNIRRSQQLSTRSSDKLWLHQRDRLKSTPLRQNEHPGRLCWTWATRRWLTESRGWTSRRFKTRWFLQHV